MKTKNRQKFPDQILGVVFVYIKKEIPEKLLNEFLKEFFWKLRENFPQNLVQENAEKLSKELVAEFPGKLSKKKLEEISERSLRRRKEFLKSLKIFLKELPEKIMHEI